ncbi:hypothetical protein [Cellulomonas sp. P24]|uniref:hypothetical protein n=1 Tax=Cellulomonas sp. P24 TaxID=2885206 RepID=UPI00216AFF93|nr:hypothetical protein [Cellulomonas sp. P24]MCR6492158.1 hypothetical protein [Cellulomonas sp. P24]
MKKIIAVALAFIAVGFVLDLLRIQGIVPRTLYFATMLSTMSWVASREYGWWGRRPPR